MRRVLQRAGGVARAVRDAGCGPQTSFVERARLRRSNELSVMIIASIVPFSIAFWRVHVELGVGALACALAYVIVISLNKLGRHLTARMIFVLAGTLSVGFYSESLGPDTDLSYMLWSVGLSVFWLFDKEDRAARALGFAAPVTYFFALHVTGFALTTWVPRMEIDPTTLRFFSLCFQAMVLIHLVAGTMLVVSLHEAAQRSLVDLNVQLREESATRLAASQAKSRFLANMSHELRTPLNAIIGYAEIVSESLEDEGHAGDEMHEDVARIRRSGRHLLSIISDILDLTKIESGRLEVHLSAVDLPGLLRDVAQECAPLVEAGGNALEIHLEGAPEHVTSDATKLRQIVLNLVSNAAKFTQGGRVTIHAAREGRERFVVEVADTGAGILPEHQVMIFDAFQQGDDSPTRAQDGTGLGLTLVRQLARLLGGEVSLRSEAGRGSSFRVELPIQCVAAT